MSESVIFICGPVERWLPVVGYEGLYEVSGLGRVRSLRPSFRIRDPSGLLSQSRGTRHLLVALRRDGQQRQFGVHRLVARAFFGPCPAGQEVRHGSGGAHDNRIVNLCYGTHQQNMGPDKLRDGTMYCGEAQHASKMTEDQVREIRARYAGGGVSQRALARDYGLAQATLRAIICHRSWKHVA